MEPTKNEFDNDIKRILEMTELLYLDGITGLQDLLIESYVQKIVTYLKINFK